MRIIDRYVYIILLIVVTLLFIEAFNFVTDISYDSIGANTFPILIMGLLIVTLILLILKPKKFYDSWNLDKEQFKKTAYLILALFGYALFFVSLGFIINTIIFIGLISIIFGANKIDAFLASTTMGLYSFIIFDRIFGVVMPLGPLATIIP
ncbi:tripartite tricarboxylate transporter TctB family protein [Thorsellia kenyensis]|uniref:Tripartite tricarboxylate transporter TctB family protein n=1 Tax=Thorsellia kenyensis TaxID=1549888 RepID=A0ABV6CAS3_9GAMM